MTQTNFIVQHRAARFNNGFVIAYQVSTDGTIKLGSSICSKSDTFDAEIGSKQAEARLNDPTSVGYSEFNVLTNIIKEIVPNVIDGTVGRIFAQGSDFTPFKDTIAVADANLRIRAFVQKELEDMLFNTEDLTAQFIEMEVVTYFVKNVYLTVKPFMRRAQKRALGIGKSPKVEGIANAGEVAAEGIVAQYLGEEPLNLDSVDETTPNALPERKIQYIDVGDVPPEVAAKIVADAIQHVPV